MAAYEHVVVVMSIVLGLAVTQLLKGAAQLYRRRAQVRTYWLHTAWVALLVLFSFLLWWTFWNYRAITDWDFLRFVVYLSPTIAFYFITVVAFPEPTDDVVSMREYYYSNRVGFFGAFAVHGVLAALTALVVRRLPILDASNLFRLLMLILLLVALRSAREQVHVAVFAVSAALMIVFILRFQFQLV